jgi:hypothetical protein
MAPSAELKADRPQPGFLARRGPLLGFLALISWTPLLCGQAAISSITTSFTAGTPSQVSLEGSQVTTDNDTLALKTLTDASGDTYTALSTSGSVALRTDLTNSDSQGFSAWYMGNKSSSGTPPSTLYAGYDSGSSASLLAGNNLLAGADNLFNNTAGTDQGDIERMDVLTNGTTGTVANSGLSFAVLDRGAGDSFEIAVITGVDSNGNPTSYGGSLVTVTSSDFGGSLLNSGDTPSTVLNNSGEPTDYLVHYDSSSSLSKNDITTDTTSTEQNLSGVVLNLSDFGITAGTTIYGYSIMASDVTDGGNIDNLVNYDNTSYFPTTTDESSGGLDPVDVGGVVFEEHPIPEPSTYGAIFLGLGFAGLVVLRVWRPRPALSRA